MAYSIVLEYSKNRQVLTGRLMDGAVGESIAERYCSLECAEVKVGA